MSLRVLEAVRDELIACQAVGSGREFCESWLAKDESYLRVLRFHQADPSPDALVTLASKLGYYAEHFGQSDRPDHANWAQRLQRLRDLCQQTLDKQARAKWMTPTRMDT
jgi:hypothetical protein